MQPEFAGALLSRLHDGYGLHTALDTQGYLARNVSSSWFDAVDLVLLDIKHIAPERYRQITSCELAPTLDFARRLVRLDKPMWIRYVLVPGLTDDAGDIARLADSRRFSCRARPARSTGRCPAVPSNGRTQMGGARS
ncbi:hypothetical protein [Trinickia terrae]|uniref:hypothetical protein n=1 Tax=Trinickia terrae TaxID=2571161 RepID=UPI00146F6968|nr:hypothetical protein [Trinickia terrae]